MFHVFEVFVARLKKRKEKKRLLLAGTCCFDSEIGMR
jgi:hypothetical protein